MAFFGLFGFGHLICSSVLIVNAIAILSPDRFLARVGWAKRTDEYAFGHGGQDAPPSMKAKIVDLIASVQMLMRIPLILVNTLMIVYLLLLG